MSASDGLYSDSLPRHSAFAANADKKDSVVFSARPSSQRMQRYSLCANKEWVNRWVLSGP